MPPKPPALVSRRNSVLLSEGEVLVTERDSVWSAPICRRYCFGDNKAPTSRRTPYPVALL